jgi:hypothetical protein
VVLFGIADQFGVQDQHAAPFVLNPNPSVLDGVVERPAGEREQDSRILAGIATICGG